MSAFTKNDIPDSINTYEKLVAWAGLVLNTINPDQTVVEGPGAPEKVAQYGIFKIDQPSKSNTFIRLSLEMEEDFAYYNGPIYERVKEISGNSVPLALKAQ